MKTRPTTSLRHSWGDPVSYLTARKTERECEKCGLVKVTRHGTVTRTEFWRGLDRVEGRGTPACVAVEIEGRAA